MGNLDFFPHFKILKFLFSLPHENTSPWPYKQVLEAVLRKSKQRALNIACTFIFPLFDY